MLATTEEFAHASLLWDDDQSWAFPILTPEENGGKLLIEGGKILTDIGKSDGQTEMLLEEAPLQSVIKGKKRRAGIVEVVEAAASKRVGGDQENEGKGGGGDFDDHELHIWTERERRKKMRNMFANLHALIPYIHPRADKSTIVDEAVLYIKKLQLTLDDLEKLKMVRLKGGNPNLTSCHPSIITPPKLPTQSREAFLTELGATSKRAVTLASPNPQYSGPKPSATFRTWTSPNVVLNVCGKDAQINVCCPKKPGLTTAVFFVMEKYKIEVVSAQVSSDHGTLMYMIHAHANGGPQPFPEAVFLAEEIYKQAAAEIMLCINS